MATAPAPKFALFVSSVAGKLVRRYGTAVHIGARAEVLNPQEEDPSRHRYKYRYQTSDIVAIPEAEFARYRREYTRALSDGSLRKRSAQEWQAQIDEATRASEEAAKSKAEKKKKTEAESQKAAGGRTK